MNSGRDTYHFILMDGLLTESNPRAFDFTNPRLGNLVRFLSDAVLQVDHIPTPEGILISGYL